MTIERHLLTAMSENPVRREELQRLLYSRVVSRWRRLLPAGKQKPLDIFDTQYVFVPFWFIKVASYADRIPFPPKVRRYVIYIDAISGERGLTDRFPRTEERDAGEYRVRSPYMKEDTIKPMVDDLVESLILRRYLLKRPSVEVMDPELVYLPHYYVRVRTADEAIRMYAVNALSAEIKMV